jgi:KDO2-lipid IV(A) lauroyltransferase
MRRALRELQYLVEFALLWPVATVARRLSPRAAERLTRVAARLAYAVLARDRKWAYKNLEIVFGDNLSPQERRRIVVSSFETIVRTRIECLRWSKDWMIRNVVEIGGELGREAMKRVQAEGKGAIVITAHLGNFEILPAWCHHTGFPSTVMYRPQNNWRVERLLMGARTDYLPSVVRRSTVGLMTLGYVLREGGNVGLLVDMNTIENPVFVDFLGFQAASPPGAAALALATGSPVILAVSVREPDGRHRLIFHPPFETIRTGDKKRDVLANTQQYMKAIESYVLAYPEQYNWPHPRWRFRPDGSFWTLQTPVSAIESERAGPARRVQSDPTPPELLATRLEGPAARAA